jgi:hypothetical protein
MMKPQFSTQNFTRTIIPLLIAALVVFQFFAAASVVQAFTPALAKAIDPAASPAPTHGIRSGSRRTRTR